MDYKFVIKKLKLDESPFKSFDHWWDEAQRSEQVEPEAFCLGTQRSNGRVRSRIVLLRERDESGFYFFTNYSSQKGQDIESHPEVSMNFHWRQPLHRQIRIEGVAERATREISDRYFETRPRGSQISAWASPQSETYESREKLEELRLDVEKRFDGKAIPRPENWGGYLIRPNLFEFWQEGEHRFHQRVLFQLKGESDWSIELLAP